MGTTEMSSRTIFDLARLNRIYLHVFKNLILFSGKNIQESNERFVKIPLITAHDVRIRYNEGK